MTALGLLKIVGWVLGAVLVLAIVGLVTLLSLLRSFPYDRGGYQP